MRRIGQLADEGLAQRFVDFLYTQKMEGQAEPASGECWTIWVHDEDHCSRARQLLQAFSINPDDPRFTDAGIRADSMRRERLRDDERWRRRQRRMPPRPAAGRLTLIMMAVCIGIFILQHLIGLPVFPYLCISNEKPDDGVGLSEILGQFQIWRLFTPSLMHGGLFHLAFNLWCLWALGNGMEWKLGPTQLLLLILGVGVGSNLAQYYYGQSGYFLGASGVIYGLLGFVWMKGRFDPGFGLALPRNIVIYMLAWLVLGYLFPRLGFANACHTAGLLLGMAGAFMPFWKPLR